MGAFHLVRTQFYMLSGPPPPPLFACNTQWECVWDLTPSPLPLGAYTCTKWKAPVHNRNEPPALEFRGFEFRHNI